MNELAALDAAANFRKLAVFYSEASQKGRTASTVGHYKRIAELCEFRAYELEIAVVGVPEEEGGQIFESDNLPVHVA